MFEFLGRSIFRYYKSQVLNENETKVLVDAYMAPVSLATKRVKVHINNVFTIGSVINSHQAYVIDENFVLDKKRNIKKFLDINLRQKLVQLKSERIVFANILFLLKC